MDEIKISGIVIYANHGVFDFEKENGQKFVIDLSLAVSTQSAGLSDDLNKTVNYAELTDFVKEVFTTKSYNLIEAAAENIAISVLKRYETVNSIEVTVSKPQAPLNVIFDNVSVSIRRKWHKAYLSVGSNLGDSRAILEEAAKIFENNRAVRNLKKASYITTKAYGLKDQPDFLNSMWEIETVLNPEELLKLCNDTEAFKGRERIIHWGPRTLDIDIIYYDNCIIDTDKLTIPHYDMENRRFVLEPLCELAPNKKSPRSGLSSIQMLKALEPGE